MKDEAAQPAIRWHGEAQINRDAYDGSVKKWPEADLIMEEDERSKK